MWTPLVLAYISTALTAALNSCLKGFELIDSVYVDHKKYRSNDTIFRFNFPVVDKTL